MAKNITTFAPGMSGSVTIGNNEWYSEIVHPMQGCTARCGPRNASDSGASNHIFKYPSNTGYNGAAPDAKRVSEIKLWMVNPGGGGAGGNCCGWGPPAASGAKAVWDLNLTASEASNQRCLHLCVPNGGCCVATNGGQQGCRWRVYNYDSAKILFAFTSPTCACWECNFYSSNKCNEVCYISANASNRVRNFNNCCTCSGADAWYCQAESECHIGDRDYLQSDSDVNVFKQEVGFAVAGCCYVAACNMSMVYPINHWCTKKAHYVSVKGHGYDCNTHGSTQMCGLAKMWGGTNFGFGRAGICEAGIGGASSVVGAGSCNCGASGGSGFYTIWYK